MKRCAADALDAIRRRDFRDHRGAYPVVKNSGGDLSLRHAARMALRDCIAHATGLQNRIEDEAGRITLDAALGSRTEAGAGFRSQSAQKAAGFPPIASAEPLSLYDNLTAVASMDLSASARNILRAIFPSRSKTLVPFAMGWRTEARQLPESLKEWVRELTEQNLQAFIANREWQFKPVPGLLPSEPAWVSEDSQNRKRRRYPFLGQLAEGEQKTGILRSPEIKIPTILEFYIAGTTDCSAGTSNQKLHSASPCGYW
ncbi:MAG: hypothetical protein R3F11_03340 [Verrucomicrobiales bacterium]